MSDGERALADEGPLLAEQVDRLRASECAQRRKQNTEVSTTECSTSGNEAKMIFLVTPEKHDREFGIMRRGQE